MVNDYRTYTIEAFALDPSFRDWVLIPDSTETAFWEAWLVQHPDRSADIEQARLLLLTLQERFRDDLTDDMVRHDITYLVRQATKTPYRKPTPVRALWTNQAGWWRVAAAVVLLVGAGWWFSQAGNPSGQTSTTTQTGIRTVVRTNETNHPITILLNDGSIVTLERHSQLTFPTRFSGNTRPVSLTGEAFFDVAENPAKPFLVFTRESVTRVVGTSFRIKATNQSPTVQVAVRTGRVAVYTRTAFAQVAPDRTVLIGEVLLKPNQQAVLTRKSGLLIKEPVVNRQATAETIPAQEITFDDQPVADVFRSLEKTYGISLLFDAEKLANCRITTAFVDESLPERLGLICQAINATYQTAGDRIDISGNGCR